MRSHGSSLDALNRWVEEVAQLTEPSSIRWCDGSDAEYADSWKAIAEQTRPNYRQSHGQPLAAAIYFMTFILLGTMIMLNLFTGVIISSMERWLYFSARRSGGMMLDSHL